MSNIVEFTTPNWQKKQKKTPTHQETNKTGARKVAERKGDLGKSLLSDQRLRLEKQILFTSCEVRLKKNKKNSLNAYNPTLQAEPYFFFCNLSTKKKWQRWGMTQERGHVLVSVRTKPNTQSQNSSPFLFSLNGLLFFVCVILGTSAACRGQRASPSVLSCLRRKRGRHRHTLV